MAYSLGIDLGTTYSAAAIARGDRLEIFQLGERAATIPSIVLLRADGEVLTGEAAERRALAEPTRTGREFKRRLGDPTPIILGGTPYGAEALLAHLLRSIVALVTQRSGEPPAAIAVCHPASYGAYKLDLLQQAVRQADIGPVTMLTEPEAAALDYARQERVPSGSVIAVYDFGGGTFDATILRKTDDGFEMLGQPEGLERLGGIDFDEALFRRAMELVAAQGVQIDANDPAAMAAIARLRDECRRAKEALSSDTDATIPIFLPGLQTELRLTRAEFEDMIRPRIHETIEALGRATRSAGLGFGELDRILLVGGSSRIPLVAEMVREATGRPVAVDAHPKHTMALGAAFVAEQQRVAAAGPARPSARRRDSAARARGRCRRVAGSSRSGQRAGNERGADRGWPGLGPVPPHAADRAGARRGCRRRGRRDRVEHAGRRHRRAIGVPCPIGGGDPDRLAIARHHAVAKPDRDAVAVTDADPDAHPDPGWPPGSHLRHHRQQRPLLGRLRGLQLHAGASERPPRPLLLRHGGAGNAGVPGTRSVGAVRRTRALHRLPRQRQAQRRHPDVHPRRHDRTTRSCPNSGNCVDLPS